MLGQNLLMSDVLSLDLPANKVIEICDLPHQRRTVVKARRNLGNARERVGWTNHIELSELQKERLEQAMIEQQRAQKVIIARNRYNIELLAYTEALSKECDLMQEFYRVNQQLCKLLMLSKQSPSKAVDESTYNTRTELQSVYQEYKDCIRTTKQHKVEIVKLLPILGIKLDKKLSLAGKQAIKCRKDIEGIMVKLRQIEEKFNEDKSDNTEAVSQVVQNSSG